MLVQLLIIQIATFIGLIVVLRILFYRHLNSALSRLKELQEDALAKEGQIREELDRAKQVRQAEEQRGKDEAKKIIEDAKRHAEALNLKAKEEARQESKRIIAQAKEELVRMEKEVLLNCEKKAVTMSLEMIKYTFSEKSKEGLQHVLFSELIDEIGKLENAKFGFKSKDVKVVSASALSPAEKERLSSVLGEKAGGPVQLEASLEPEIIMGLVVKLGPLTIDGSLKNKLKKVIPYLKSER